MCNVSCVTCHLSCVICHIFYLFIFFTFFLSFVTLKKLTKWWELVGGWFVINGAWQGGIEHKSDFLRGRGEKGSLGEISSNLYRASVCDMEKGVFLLISLSQILYYTLQTTWYGIIKNIFGKLPDHWWLLINTINFEGCHTLTHIFQILIIITFSTQLMTNVLTIG